MTHSEAEGDGSFLPPKPTPPLPNDCCGSGCSPCINNLYDEELLLWSKLCKMSLQERRQWHEQKIAHVKDQHSLKILNPELYTQFELIAIKPISTDSYIFSFAIPNGYILGIGVGQHIVLRIRNKYGEVITRQYTPVSPRYQTDTFDIVIKIYDEGQASQEIKEWNVGTQVEWKGPFGLFSYQPNEYKSMVLLACGTGIAPFIQVIQEILDNGDDITQIHLLYSSRTQKDILLKSTLDKFKDYWNFTVEYILTRSSHLSLECDRGFIKYNDIVSFERINEDSIAKHTKGDISSCSCLICGTKVFNKDMMNIVLRCGFKRENIFIF